MSNNREIRVGDVYTCRKIKKLGLNYIGLCNYNEFLFQGNHHKYTMERHDHKRFRVNEIYG